MKRSMSDLEIIVGNLIILSSYVTCIIHSPLHDFKNADDALESDVPDLFFNAIPTFISLL